MGILHWWNAPDHPRPRIEPSEAGRAVLGPFGPFGFHGTYIKDIYWELMGYMIYTDTYVYIYIYRLHNHMTDLILKMIWVCVKIIWQPASDYRNCRVVVQVIPSGFATILSCSGVNDSKQSKNRPIHNQQSKVAMGSPEWNMQILTWTSWIFHCHV